MYLHNLRAELLSALLPLGEAGAERAAQVASDRSSFGWGLCGVKGQLIVGFILKISLSLNISILACVAPTA